MKKIFFILFCLLLFSLNANAALTSGNVTIKTSGGDYSSWAAFWNDLGNLTGNITCTVDASAFTEDSAPSHTAESLGGHTLTVTAATFPTKSDASDGPRFTCNYTDEILNMGMEGSGAIIIEGMVFIEGTSKPTECIDCVGIDNNFTFTFRRNIVKGCGDGFYGYDPTAQYEVYNNFFYDSSVFGVYRCSHASSFVANNTIVDGATGIDGANAAGTFENNICYGNTTDFANIGSATGNNNTSYDATCANGNWSTGVNNRESKTADPFTASGSDDFTLVANSDPIGNGKDLSGSFTVDFFGDTRSTWDIGADYYAAAAPSGEGKGYGIIIVH